LKWKKNISTGKPIMEEVKQGFYTKYDYNAIVGDDLSKIMLL
jgi:hypothetical protein